MDNNLLDKKSSTYFNFTSPISLNSFYPLLGSYFGGTSIHIVGSGIREFDYSGTVRGSSNFITSFYNSSSYLANKWSCKFCLTRLSFNEIFGVSIDDTKSVPCFYAEAWYVSSSQLSCKTPAFDSLVNYTYTVLVGPNVPNWILRNATVSVAVSDNGVDFYGIPEPFHQFTYFPAPKVTNILPSRGILTGGTPVLVVGSNLNSAQSFVSYFPDSQSSAFNESYIPELLCKFGSKIVRSFTVINSTAAICYSPSSNIPEEVPFSITYNGYDWVSTNFNFSFVNNSECISMFPSWTVVNSGTKVRLVGVNFFMYSASQSYANDPYMLPAFWLLFNHTSIPYTRLSDTVIEFFAPVVNNAGFVPVEVQWADTGSISTSGLLFRYVLNLNLSIIDPANINFNGGREIVIHGTFTNETNMKCKFGVTLTPVSFISLSYVCIFLLK